MRFHTAARRPLAVVFILLAGAMPTVSFFATAGGAVPLPIGDPPCQADSRSGR